MDVTVIIPTYNRLWSLPKAIGSCHEPALSVEVIVVDDGSTDGTWEWLTSQPEIIAVRQENLGKDWAVNKAFEQASGKYIRFLDSDDWILPGSTLALFNKAESEDLDVVAAGYERYDDHEQLITEVKWTVCDDLIAQQLGECDSSHYGAYLFRKKFIENIPHRQEYGGLDDRQFIIEVAMKKPRSGYISTLALAHRIHTNARLQRVNKLDRAAYHLAYYNIYKKALGRLEQTNELTPRRKKAAAKKLWHLAHWIAETDITEGRHIFKWVYELDPNFLPNDNSTLARSYKTLGFTTTEKLAQLKRYFKI